MLAAMFSFITFGTLTLAPDANQVQAACYGLDLGRYYACDAGFAGFGSCWNGSVCLSPNSRACYSQCGNWTTYGNSAYFSGEHDVHLAFPTAASSSKVIRNRQYGSKRTVCAYSDEEYYGSGNWVSYWGSTWYTTSFKGIKSFRAIPAGIRRC